MAQQKILIVDDDKNIAEQVGVYLSAQSYDTRIVLNGEDALTLHSLYKPDLIILDVVLPGVSGYEVCQQIHENSDTPVILISEKGNIEDKLRGFEAGADDYLVKPFDNRELAVRITAVLRRCIKEVPVPGPASTEKSVHYPGLSINLTNYSVELGGRSIDMPPKELELLYFLASSPNQVFTREQLLDQIWGYEYAGDTRTVDVHIKRLRKKLGTSENWTLRTVWGIGYKFEVKQ